MLRSQQAKSQLIFAKKEFAGRVILYTVDNCAEKKMWGPSVSFSQLYKAQMSQRL